MEPLTTELLSLHEHAQVSMLRESIKRLYQAIDSMAAPIYICDKDGYIKFYNKAAVELWGRVPEIGKDLWCGSWKIYTPNGLPMSFDECPMAKALREGRSVRGEEIVIERPDGVKLTLLPHADPIFDLQGQIVEGVSMFVEVTPAREKEKELSNNLKKARELVADLEQKVKEKIRNLSEANAALRQSNAVLERLRSLQHNFELHTRADFPENQS